MGHRMGVIQLDPFVYYIGLGQLVVVWLVFCWGKTKGWF